MKILVSDLDVNMNNLEFKELVDIVNQFISKGNMFIIATDNSLKSVVDINGLLEMNAEYYICNDGAVIFDRYFNVLFRKDLKPEVVKPILELLDSDDNILESFVDTSHGFVRDTNVCANGIVAHPYDNVKAEMLLSTISLKFPSIHGHINDNGLNIVDINVSKVRALNYLRDNYNLGESEIYVLGKGINDLELMEQYNGYVLSDCSEDLRKYAKDEVSSIKELIEFLIQEEEQIDNETIYA